MTRLAAWSQLTAAEYLAWEREQVDKHEFHAGEVFAMAGGSPRHNWIAAQAHRALMQALDDRCFTFTSGQRIVFADGTRYVYPDASVVCGPVKVDGGSIAPTGPASGSRSPMAHRSTSVRSTHAPSSYPET